MVAVALAGCSGHATVPQVRVGAFLVRAPAQAHVRRRSSFAELTSAAHPGLTTAVGAYYGIRVPARAALPHLAADWLTGGDDASYRSLDRIRSLDVGASGATVAAFRYAQRLGVRHFHGLLVLLVAGSGDALMMDTYTLDEEPAWDALDRYALSLVPRVRPTISRTASRGSA